MVLRGSNITPESSLGEVVEGLNVAQERLSLAQEELDIIHKSSVEDLLKKIESKETDRAELIAISGEIKSRISLLEKKQSQAWWEVISKQEAIDRTLRQLACGGLAGAIARSTVAPLDRVKILIQTASVTGTTDKFNSILGTARYVIKSEGLGGLWRGNLTNCVRVVPRKYISFFFFLS